MVKGRGGGGERRGGSRHGRGERVSFQEVAKENRLYELYYNELGTVDEDEQKAFWDALRRELPNSFRFTGSKGHALAVQHRLEDHYIPQITSIEHEGQLVAPPTPITWYPDRLAWQMTTPKHVIRRSPPFAAFQRYLVSETSVGNINRQEVVSMIPPLLMDIRPGMTVLDMCAAPGSKSAQLIEMVHAGEEADMKAVFKQRSRQDERNGSLEGSEDYSEPGNSGGRAFRLDDDGRSTGLLIANDADYKRAHMLIHQMKRLNSPNLIVTNHDATMYPSIKLPSNNFRDGVRSKGRYLKFDRILADVPCSGDGTARKNSGVWKDWGPGNALGLFSVQVRILFRALQMLKIGGRVVYSTCSMNPVENEAVVSVAIKRAGGTSRISLIDCSNELPLLLRRPGLRRWKIMDKRGWMWNSWQEVEKEKGEHGPDGLGRLTEEMFPVATDSEEDAVPLERCMRVYPHLQDTGGFFIAVLEKTAEVKTKTESMPQKATESAEDTMKPERIPPTSIVAVAEEISAQAGDSAHPVEKLDTLDSILPPVTDDINRNPSAAARQNKENPLVELVSPGKHALDDVGDASAATKRPMVRGDDDVAAPRGMENRQVHYPPPPGAVLNLTSRGGELSSPPPESMPTTESLPVPATPMTQGANLNPSTAREISNINGQYKKKNNTPVEEPFKYLDPKHEELRTIYEFYQLDPRFPRDRFMVRNATGSASKTIYYTSALAKDILTENEGKGMKFVHCGIKMFVKQDVQREGICRWRIQNEGLSILESWVGGNRVIRMHRKSTFKLLLQEMFPKISRGGTDDLSEIGERLENMDMGCCVLRVEPSEGEDGFQ